MTDEPPDGNGRPASGAAARLAALLAEFEAAHPTGGLAPAPAPAPAPADPAATREAGTALRTLRARLAELAELEPAGAPRSPAAPPPAGPSRPSAAPGPMARGPRLVAAPPAVPPAPPGTPPVLFDREAVTGEVPPPPPPVPPSSTVTEPAPAPVPVPVPDAGGTPEAAPELAVAPAPEAEPSPAPTEARPRARWLTRVTGVAMVLLVLAIPVLGYAGARTLANSRAGKVSERSLDPTAPGYIAIVEPTPTALVIQTDAEDRPVSLTVLALGAGEAGGSVLFIPLDTYLVRPALYIDRLRTAFARGGLSTLAAVTSNLLGIGFDRVVHVSDADWAQLVAPVSPLRFDNPSAIAIGTTSFPQGPIELPADQVGTYLSAVAFGQEDDLDRLDRHQLLWKTWLQAIADLGPDGVPSTTNGLGPFIGTLTAGTPTMATLSVVPSATLAPDGQLAFDLVQDEAYDQIADAVPAPVSPGLGLRFSTRVLNGVDGEPIPESLLRALRLAGAQIDSIGNAPKFGVRQTSIEYHTPRRKETAEKVRDELGGGRIHLDAETNDPVDLVIVLGPDALEKFSGG